MDIVLICVGKMRGTMNSAAEDYAARIARYVNLSIVEVDDQPEPAHDTFAAQEAVRVKEGTAILRHVRPSDYVIVTCVEGVQRDSVAWSRFLHEQSARRVVMIIGGSLGLSSAVYARADARVSFSKMTFPHQLMRVMLLEQVYRAIKIHVGERYHK